MAETVAVVHAVRISARAKRVTDYSHGEQLLRTQTCHFHTRGYHFRTGTYHFRTHRTNTEQNKSEQRHIICEPKTYHCIKDTSFSNREHIISCIYPPLQSEKSEQRHTICEQQHIILLKTPNFQTEDISFHASAFTCEQKHINYQAHKNYDRSGINILFQHNRISHAKDISFPNRNMSFIENDSN